MQANTQQREDDQTVRVVRSECAWLGDYGLNGYGLNGHGLIDYGLVDYGLNDERRDDFRFVFTDATRTQLVMTNGAACS